MFTPLQKLHQTAPMTGNLYFYLVICSPVKMSLVSAILLSNTTTAQNEVAFSYHRVHGLYFLELFIMLFSSRFEMLIMRHWSITFNSTIINVSLRNTVLKLKS